jgi:DNA-binding CsgD family transcriptional regulator
MRGELVALFPEFEARILHHHHVDKWRIGTIARQLGIHHATVEHFLARADLPRNGRAGASMIDAYLPFIRQTLESFPTITATRLYRMVQERGYSGGDSHFRHVVGNLRPRFDAFDWMLAVLQKKIDYRDLRHQLGDVTDLETLLNYLYSGRLSERNKSMAILACQRGLTNDTICRFLGISSNTLWNYKRTFAKGASDALFSRKPSSSRKSNDEALKNAIFKILHEPPSNYGINRTSWTMSFLRDALRANGRTACPEVIRGITRVAGYHWRKARVVLTSADPKYSEKLDRIHSILSNLQPDEAFFSIDEYGPFAVKAYGGRTLVAPGEQPVVHQWQKTRGSLILTAALELSSNQITHFYSNRKNTDEMIKLMDILIIKYANRRKIYLSWDVASWHIAKRLNQCIETHNAKVAAKGGVVVETAPLPSGAQFLNVIESVFSGMSRAIIQNSNYHSLADARAAVDRYFKERNDFFETHPQRAGRKIWGKERAAAAFSESSNCKDPRYR